MKSLFSILVISVLSFQSSAQESMEKIMESRAKEMFRIIGINDKDQWGKFLKENFTQAFIDRNMKAKVATSEGVEETTSITESSAANNLEVKSRCLPVFTKILVMAKLPLSKRLVRK